MGKSSKTAWWFFATPLKNDGVSSSVGRIILPFPIGK
jgi:hypothetical protein